MEDNKILRGMMARPAPNLEGLGIRPALQASFANKKKEDYKTEETKPNNENREEKK